MPHVDFYNVRKIDNHVHLAACMNAKHLSRFIKQKLKSEGDTIVMQRDGVNLTLNDVFEELNIKPSDLSVDLLNCIADSSTFLRFDRFNRKYNPLG